LFFTPEKRKLPKQIIDDKDKDQTHSVWSSIYMQFQIKNELAIKIWTSGVERLCPGINTNPEEAELPRAEFTKHFLSGLGAVEVHGKQSIIEQCLEHLFARSTTSPQGLFYKNYLRFVNTFSPFPDKIGDGKEYLQNIENLCKLPYFFGYADRDSAKESLVTFFKKEKKPCFIIRLSSRDHGKSGDFTLDTLTDGKTPAHTIFEPPKYKKVFLRISPKNLKHGVYQSPDNTVTSIQYLKVIRSSFVLGEKKVKQW